MAVKQTVSRVVTRSTEWFGIFFSAFNKGYSNCTNLSAQNNEIAFNEVVNDLNATSMHHCNMDVDRTQKS